MGQALQLHNLFANKAAHKYEQELLRSSKLEEELKKMKAEKDNKQKELNDAANALNTSNEKVLNLSSSLQLSKEKVDVLTKTVTAKDKDIKEIKEQLLEVHDTSSFKARLETLLEFKAGQLSVETIDEEIKEL